MQIFGLRLQCRQEAIEGLFAFATGCACRAAIAPVCKCRIRHHRLFERAGAWDRGGGAMVYASGIPANGLAEICPRDSPFPGGFIMLIRVLGRPSTGTRFVWRPIGSLQTPSSSVGGSGQGYILGGGRLMTLEPTSNPYERMPMNELRRHALLGVSLARQAWRVRDPKVRHGRSGGLSSGSK